MNIAASYGGRSFARRAAQGPASLAPTLFFLLLGAIISGAGYIVRAGVLVPEVWGARFHHGTQLAGPPTLGGFRQLMFYGGVPVPEGFARTGFSAVFSTCLRIPTASLVEVELGSDDGSRLRVDDKTFIDLWSGHSNLADGAAFDLSAGPHLVTVEYFQSAGDSALFFKFRLSRSGPMLLSSPLLSKPTLDEAGRPQCKS